jgi:hypothetical protein
VKSSNTRLTESKPRLSWKLKSIRKLKGRQKRKLSITESFVSKSKKKRKNKKLQRKKRRKQGLPKKRKRKKKKKGKKRKKKKDRKKKNGSSVNIENS